MRVQPAAILIRVMAVSIVALFLGAHRPALAQSPLDPASALYRVYFESRTQLSDLSRELDIWEIDHRAGYVIAPLTPDQVVDLQERRVVTQVHTPLAVRAQASDLACYRTVEETAATLSDLAARYPHLARLHTIGPSWDKASDGGPNGYDLQVLVVGNQSIPGPKFTFFLLGAVHAREMTTAETALRFTESLLAGYGKDPDATWLLDYGELHVLPMANPDGRKYAEAGLLWRKNTNRDAACTSNTFGVDLNRNSSFKWNSCPGCSSADACSLTYRGVAPASEPETQAIETYVAGLFDDARPDAQDAAAPEDTPGLLISLHSYGRLVLYPWGWTNAPAPNGAQLQTLARRFGFYLGYDVCQSGADDCLYPTDGTTDDWAYGELGVAAYTFELGTSFFQDCRTFEAAIMDDALAALRYGFKAAHAPYRLASGPEILNAAPGPAVVAGAVLTLTAAADDTRSYGGVYGSDPAQAIIAARGAVDTLLWQDNAQAFTATAIDGKFSSPSELLAFELDTTGLAPGRHLVMLQARDAGENWGPPTGVFIEILPSPVRYYFPVVSIIAARVH